MVGPFGADERDGEDVFEEAKRRLAGSFAATPAGRDLGWLAEQVVDLKWRYLDGDMARWPAADVRTLLLDIYPRQIGLRNDELAVVPPGLAALLRFLAHEQLLDPREADDGARLAVELTGAFLDAMRNDSGWGPSKRMVAMMTEQGVDVTDQQQLDQWAAEFNARPFGERDAMLGPPSAGASTFPRLPSVVLAPEAELVAAADAAPWIRQLRLMADYIGDGRAVTPNGNLRLADAKELVALIGTDDRPDPVIGDRTFRTKSSADLRGVDQPFRVALSAGFLARKGNKVVPGHNIAMLRDDSLGAVYGLMLCLLNTDGPTTYRWGDDQYGWGWYAEAVDEMLTPLLIQQYCEQTPTKVADLSAATWRTLEDEYDLSDLDSDGPFGRRRTFHQDLVGSAVSDAMLVFADLGLVTTTAPTRAEARADTSFDDELEADPTADPLAKPPSGDVDLTPLGTWALQRFLATITDAPTLGSLVTANAAELLHAAADLPEAGVAAEVDHWVAQHDDAAAQLVAALRGASATGRVIAYRALLRVGRAAAPAWDDVADDPDLFAHAALFRSDAGLATPDEIVADTDERYVRLLAAVLDVWGADAVAPWAEQLAGPGGVSARIETMWRLDVEATSDVLAALGDRLPDKQQAKAARKALFRRSSRG